MLVEQLEETLQCDVRLGLLAARTAVGLSRLPRGNQRQAADVVTRRGLTTHQSDRLVGELLAASGQKERRQILDAAARGSRKSTEQRGRNDTHRVESPALRIVRDIGRLRQVAARLEARLLERPLCSLSVEGEASVRESLDGLRAVLEVLRRVLERGADETEEKQ